MSDIDRWMTARKEEIRAEASERASRRDEAHRELIKSADLRSSLAREFAQRAERGGLPMRTIGVTKPSPILGIRKFRRRRSKAWLLRAPSRGYGDIESGIAVTRDARLWLLIDFSYDYRLTPATRRRMLHVDAMILFDDLPATFRQTTWHATTPEMLVALMGKFHLGTTGGDSPA